MAVLAFLNKLSRKLLGTVEQNISLSSLPVHDLLVERARQELQAARSLFDNVSERDLIDYAIFKLNAAERRYIFLLQEARRRQTCEQETDDKGGNPTGELE